MSLSQKTNREEEFFYSLDYCLQYFPKNEIKKEAGPMNSTMVKKKKKDLLWKEFVKLPKRKIIHYRETDVKMYPSPLIIQSGNRVHSFKITEFTWFTNVTQHLGADYHCSNYFKFITYVSILSFYICISSIIFNHTITISCYKLKCSGKGSFQYISGSKLYLHKYPIRVMQFPRFRIPM